MVKMNKELKEVASDNSEWAHFLSRYVDDEILKVSKKAAKQIENIKILSAKLTEQFKKHLINHENMKTDIYKRFEFIEKHLPIYWSELYKLMEVSETRMLNKMKETKESIDKTMLNNFKATHDRMDQFSELVDVNLDTLRKAITDNREVFVSVVNKVNDDSYQRHELVVEDLKALVSEIIELSRAVELVEKKSDENILEVKWTMTDQEALINATYSKEKAAWLAMTTQLAGDVDRVEIETNK